MARTLTPFRGVVPPDHAGFADSPVVMEAAGALMPPMLPRLLLLLLTLAATAARAQEAPPGFTRHGNWLEGRVAAQGQEMCIAGTPAPRQGSLQVTVGRGQDGAVILVVAIRMERVRFTADEAVRFSVDGRTFEMPGTAAGGGGPAILVAASTEQEARTLSDLLVAMRRGRELRVQVGNRSALTLSLTGASPALGAMRSCAQRAGMMPR